MVVVTVVFECGVCGTALLGLPGKLPTEPCSECAATDWRCYHVWVLGDDNCVYCGASYEEIHDGR